MGIVLLKKSLKENDKELILEALRSFHKSSQLFQTIHGQDDVYNLGIA